MNRETDRNRTRRASELAEELLEDLCLDSLPIDPLAIADGERPLLVAKGGNLGNLFDGQLEFHRRKDRFVLLYNTKYDRPGEGMHPRTRFSLAHELGHYYLPQHNDHLRGGGASHQSRGEFTADITIEREADAFAAGLLLPKKQLVPRVRGKELTPDLIGGLAEEFCVSWMATSLRCLEVTDSPCGLFALRDGRVAWKRTSELVIEAGAYPHTGDRLRSASAKGRWERFHSGSEVAGAEETPLGSWFETYDRDHLDSVLVTEQYLAIPVMGTLLVLVTMDEEDLFPDD